MVQLFWVDTVSTIDAITVAATWDKYSAKASPTDLRENPAILRLKKWAGIAFRTTCPPNINFVCAASWKLLTEIAFWYLPVRPGVSSNGWPHLHPPINYELWIWFPLALLNAASLRCISAVSLLIVSVHIHSPFWTSIANIAVCRSQPLIAWVASCGRYTPPASHSPTLVTNGCARRWEMRPIVRNSILRYSTTFNFRNPRFCRW